MCEGTCGCNRAADNRLAGCGMNTHSLTLCPVPAGTHFNLFTVAILILPLQLWGTFQLKWNSAQMGGSSPSICWGWILFNMFKTLPGADGSSNTNLVKRKHFLKTTGNAICCCNYTSFFCFYQYYFFLFLRWQDGKFIRLQAQEWA